MNSIFYNDFLKYYSNLHTQKSRDYFNNSYFIALYTYCDEYVTSFEDIKSATNFFNIQAKHLIGIIKGSGFIDYQGKRYKLCLIEKEHDIDKFCSRSR